MYPDSPFAPRRGHPQAANAYRATALSIQVAAADAHRLVALLFEGFETAVVEAQGAIASGDTERKCAALTRAIRIVDEGLRSRLNLSAGGELARDLADLYAYVIARLSLANVRNDRDLLAECTRLMRPLHEAWMAIGPTVRNRR